MSQKKLSGRKKIAACLPVLLVGIVGLLWNWDRLTSEEQKLVGKWKSPGTDQPIYEFCPDRNWEVLVIFGNPKSTWRLWNGSLYVTPKTPFSLKSWKELTAWFKATRRSKGIEYRHKFRWLDTDTFEMDGNKLQRWIDDEASVEKHARWKQVNERLRAEKLK